MVELRARRCDVVAGIPDSQRARRLSHRFGCPRCHRCSPDFASSGEAFGRADFDSRRLTSQGLTLLLAVEVVRVPNAGRRLNESNVEGLLLPQRCPQLKKAKTPLN